MRTNCFLYALLYKIRNPKSKFVADWDKEFGFWHFYNLHAGFEIHCEQINKNKRWSPFFKAKVIKIKFRRKNRLKYANRA